MTPHNQLIYHCLSCGSVKMIEPDDRVPECCGTKMTKSAAETVGFDDDLAPRHESHVPIVPNSTGDVAARH